jgi:hypothetical protein
MRCCKCRNDRAEYLDGGQWLIDPLATTVDIATLAFVEGAKVTGESRVERRGPDLASALGCEIQMPWGRGRKLLSGHGFGIGVLKETAFSFHNLVCVDRYVLRNNRLRANGFERLDFMRSR